MAYLLAHVWANKTPPKLYQTLSEKKEGSQLFLHDLAVSALLKGSGVGKQMVEQLKLIAKQHVLLTVFFENTELEELISEDAENLETIYEKTIAQKFFYEKKLIVKELEKYGVYAILTKPKNLSVNVINKYLEFKSKGLI